MPLDTTTPSRSGGTSGVPASAHASLAATIANCSHRSSRRAWHAVEHRGRVHSGPRGDPAGRLGVLLVGQHGRATAPGQHALPGTRYVAAERRGRAEAGDHDTWLVCPHFLISSFAAVPSRTRRHAASGPGDQAETSARRT